jgi:hypothetical protein
VLEHANSSHRLFQQFAPPYHVWVG